MTPWSQIISTIIFTLGTPICVGIAVVLARNFSQKLPDLQRQALEQFARMAVRQVEQQYPNNMGKKALVQASTALLFKSFNLPTPPPDALDIAIDAALYDLDHENSPPEK